MIRGFYGWHHWRQEKDGLSLILFTLLIQYRHSNQRMLLCVLFLTLLDSEVKTYWSFYLRNEMEKTTFLQSTTKSICIVNDSDNFVAYWSDLLCRKFTEARSFSWICKKQTIKSAEEYHHQQESHAGSASKICWAISVESHDLQYLCSLLIHI